MTESCNHFGFPVDAPEAETWRDEMSASERATYDALLERVTDRLRGYLGPDLCAQAVEETLWQIRCLARQQGPLDLPGAGRLIPQGPRR